MEEPTRDPGRPEPGDSPAEGEAAGRERRRITGTAASSPDISKLELLQPPERAKAHEASTVDAMGKDKRREVIGHSYGPSTARQALFYGLALGLIVVLFVGGVVLTNNFDKAPENDPDQAPWSDPSAPQQPAKRPQ